MSISSLISQISSIDREIYNFQQQLSTLNNQISNKQKDAHRILEKIDREKDFRRLIEHQKELTRKNEEISRLERDKANKEKYLSDKQKRKYELQQLLAREEQRERDKVKREQQEILSIQQNISREMDRQKFRSLSTIQTLKPTLTQKEHDVFVSHASEDKEDFVRPFVKALLERGVEVWYDEFELTIGMSLRRTIENGLKSSKYGIVVLSEHFFNKEWPQKELDGLFAKEINGEKVILPLWHKISKNEVLEFSPIIADMVALNTSNFTIDELADKIADVIRQT